MSEAAISIYNSLDSIEKIKDMISNGESENLHLECKGLTIPKLTTDTRAKLSKVLSGFSNTDGGVILYGVATEKHLHNKLDVLKQIDWMGDCEGFARQIQAKMPSLTTPSIINAKVKTLKENEDDTKGIVAVLILKTLSDPVQVVKDGHFYYHTGTGFEKCPHEMIKRLFAATESPELVPWINGKKTGKKSNDEWKIDFNLANLSSAIGEYPAIIVNVINFNNFESIHPYIITDVSNLNPGHSVFLYHPKSVIHKGLPIHCGSLNLIPKSSNKLELNVTVFANKMRSTKRRVSVVLADPPVIKVSPPQY